MKKLFVGNLPWSATDEDVRSLLTPYGEVYSVKVILDRDTGRSRGFAFAELDDAAAEQVLANGAGFELEGRALRVNEAQERTRGGGGGGRGGGGGGRGGYGGGGGGYGGGGGGGGGYGGGGGGGYGGGGGGGGRGGGRGRGRDRDRDRDRY